jgi:hypothetical protein
LTFSEPKIASVVCESLENIDELSGTAMSEVKKYIMVNQTTLITETLSAKKEEKSERAK